MRVIITVILAALLGIAIGFGVAAWRLHAAHWDGSPTLFTGPEGLTSSGGDGGLSKVEIAQTEYKFGTMDLNEEKTHDFVFSNRGDVPLVLKKGGSSCRCAVSSLDKEEIPPGASTKVKLKFKAKEVTGPYRQTALIYTNDPDRPEVTLTVSGEVTVAVRAEPAELVFTRIPAGQGATAEVRLFCQLSGPALEIPDFVYADKDISPYFDVQFQPIPIEQVRAVRHARSGVLMRVTVKPGLPQGRFHQTMLLRTNLESAPAVTVPVKGSVESDISVAGQGWDTEQGMVHLGTVSNQTGIERRLILITRGSHGKEAKFRPLRITPELLQVTVEKTTPLGNEASQTPLIIHIPKGTRPVSHLSAEQGGFGEIILETNLHKLPQFRILVRFAVAG
jgi:hypothetical protein